MYWQDRPSGASTRQTRACSCAHLFVCRVYARWILEERKTLKFILLQIPYTYHKRYMRHFIIVCRILLLFIFTNLRYIYRWFAFTKKRKIYFHVSLPFIKILDTSPFYVGILYLAHVARQCSQRVKLFKFFGERLVLIRDCRCGYHLFIRYTPCST